MAERSGGRGGAKLERAKQRFEEWRGAHSPFTRVPEPLWRLATSVARDCGAARTAQALRLNYGALKRRLVSAAAVAHGSRTGLPGQTESRFVELLRNVEPAPPCVLFLENACGTRLRVELSSAADGVALVRSLWGAAP
jgi:hypothetical protein